MAGPAEPLSAAAHRWRVALLLLALIMLLGDLWALAHAPRALLPDRAGSLLFEPGPSLQGNTVVIKSLDPASPLAAAGARVGDLLRADRVNDLPVRRAMDTEESIAYTLTSGASERRVVVRPAPDPTFRAVRAWVNYFAGWGARFVMLVFGVLILVRRPESLGLCALAVWLMLNSFNGGYFLPGGVLSGFYYEHLSGLVWVLRGLGLLGFVLYYPDERPAIRVAAWRWSGALMAALIVAIGLVDHVVERGWLKWQGTLLATWLVGGNWFGAINLVQLFEFAVLWFNWRRSSGAERTRMAWIGVAIGLVPCVYAAMALVELSPFWPAFSAYQYSVVDLGALVAALFLAWAVLRHRVFNFGLVVQRAVALSVVSSLLLTLLGLGKWGAERLLHALGHTSGLLSDLLIALFVVSLFALVQQRLLRGVNALVFRRWHESAEALRQFVDHAAQLTEPAQLQQRFVAAVDAFAGGSGSALYRADEQGHLLLVHASLPDTPERIDATDGLTSQLRHGTRRVDLTRLRSSAPGEWAFAMSVRGRISGTLLLGSRPDGVAYRPEELEQLGDSARRIGLDLESLRVLELERAHDALAQELAQAREQQALAARPSTP